MMSPRNKTLSVVAAVIALVGFQTYAFVSTRNAINDRMSVLESEIQKVNATTVAQASQTSSDLDVITSKMGVTVQELEAARHAAAQIKEEQARTAAKLRTELARNSELNSQAVDSLREESTTKLAEVQEQAATQIGAVSGDVQTVKVDLNSTKSDLAASRREMGDMRDSLGREIARNSEQLGELRRRGERDYYEFDIPKSKTAVRLADIQLQLKKADIKKQRYDVAMLVDDSNLEKKGQLVNEPVTFLVGRDHVRYELVVNSVEKDRIRGYVSTPKDKGLAGEGPSFRQ